MSLHKETMVRLLKEAEAQGATEIHLKVPGPPIFRVDGRLTPTKQPRLTPRDTQEAAFSLCAMAQIEVPVGQIADYEFSFGVHRVGRFRAYLYRQRGSLAVVVRRFQTRVPTLLDLGVDLQLERFVGARGLVLVVGDRRTELLAAMVAAYNARCRGHVVCLEAPLTYLHRDAAALISAREVGSDVPSYAAGIDQAMRVGVDLLVVGDATGADCVERLLQAAEDGVPVIGAVGAPTAELAGRWMSRAFFGEHRETVEERLDLVLRAVASLSREHAPELITREPRLRAAV